MANYLHFLKLRFSDNCVLNLIRQSYWKLFFYLFYGLHSMLQHHEISPTCKWPSTQFFSPSFINSDSLHDVGVHLFFDTKRRKFIDSWQSFLQIFSRIRMKSRHIQINAPICWLTLYCSALIYTSPHCVAKAMTLWKRKYIEIWKKRIKKPPRYILVCCSRELFSS